MPKKRKSSNNILKSLKYLPSHVALWWSKRKEKPRHERHQWALNPIMQGTYWCITFILAAAASLYSSEIKSTSPPATPKNETLNFLAKLEVFFQSISLAGYIFLFLAFISALFFAYTAWIKSLRENFIFHTIQTNPPQGFWEKFEEAVLETKKVYDSIQEIAFRDKIENAHIEECELGVRTILDYMINLVLCWDTANTERKVIYRANIMEVTYFKDHPEYELKNLDTSLSTKDVTQEDLERFLHQPITKHYSGIITLSNNKYTTTTETDDSTPDDTIKPIALPFCFVSEQCPSKFHTNLRGAPYSVATDTPDYVDSVTKIVSHYEEYAEPNSSRILSNLKKYYYKRSSPAQSILSIPLKAKKESGESQIDWVLNIYRNQPKMLYNKEKNKQFTQILSPLTTSLQDILDMISVARSKAKSDDTEGVQELDER